MILCVDPGLRGCGCAVFTPEGALTQAAYVKGEIQDGRGAHVWASTADAVLHHFKGRDLALFHKVIVETQIIRPTDEPFKQSAMMEVQGVAGAVAGIFAGRGARVIGVLPHEWKSTIDGSVMTGRISQRITPAEWENFKSHGRTGALDHNSLDAVGIGLWHFDRLHKERVIHR